MLGANRPLCVGSTWAADLHLHPFRRYIVAETGGIIEKPIPRLLAHQAPPHRVDLPVDANDLESILQTLSAVQQTPNLHIMAEHPKVVVQVAKANLETATSCTEVVDLLHSRHPIDITVAHHSHTCSQLQQL